MRLAYFLVGALLLAPAVVSAAQTQPEGEEFLPLDLRALPNGKLYFLECSNPNAKGATDCGFLSLWEQSNDVKGLQTGVLHKGKAWEPDTHLLG